MRSGKMYGRKEKNANMGQIKANNCNLTTCRYNENGKCTNEEKRKECVEVSKLVLCLESEEK